MKSAFTDCYLVAGYKSWNREVFDDILRKLPGEWHFVGSRDELTLRLVKRIRPRYIFFLHWSWIVPPEILQGCECVCFHMTDVPYGRGGSPLQNLIVRGHRNTKLAALRMTGELDAGPVYFKQTLSLAGSAEAIYRRANRLSARMIARLVRERPQPVPQSGEPVIFRRRTPRESLVPRTTSLAQLYDFIRMLDAEGYPRAFLEHEGVRYEFSGAALKGDRLTARVSMTPIEGAHP